MKKIRVFIYFLSFILIGASPLRAQVGIGTIAPHTSSILDLTSVSKGLLIPRLTLAQKNAIGTPATGLLIFQTDGASGFWYYDGTIWIPFLSSGNGWALIGNSGTIDGTNFLGTTDNTPFSIRVNNALSGRIDNVKSNVYLGYQSGLNTNGNKNSFFGHLAGNGNVTGDENTAIGYRAGITNTNGTKNTFLGTNSDAASGGLSNATAIGNSAVVSTSNSLVLGGTGANAVNVGIGYTAPGSTLDVNGKTRTTNFQMTNSPILNYVLTSDATGNGSWADPTSTAWKLLGNSGTTAGTNFIGTTDAIDFVTKTNSTERMRVTSGGLVGIGTSSPTAGSLLDVKGNLTLSNGGTASELRFYEPSGSGTNYTGFKAPAQAANVTYTLPIADGTNGQILTTNGTGTLSWTSGAGTTYALTAVLNDPAIPLGETYTFLSQVAVPVIAGDVLVTNAFFSADKSGNPIGIRVSRSTTSGSGSVGTIIGYAADEGGDKKWNCVSVVARDVGIAASTWYYKLWVMAAYDAGTENYQMVVTKYD